MRLVTYNIRGGLGIDGRRSIDRVADVVRALAADVVCLQEVHQHLPQSRFEDQPDALSRRLGMPVVFHGVSRLGIGRFGNAILTRLPIRSVGKHQLTNERERERVSMRWERRGLLEIALDAPGGTLHAMTAHFSLNGVDRLVSASTAAEVVRACAGPVALAGDFNATPDAMELREMARLGGLVDAAADRPEPTFPAGAARVRIDSVWLSPALGPAECRVVASAASDHLPLVVDW